MDLDAYLKRIDFTGSIKPDRPTLNALMSAHLNAIPFENLNQQLGIPVSTDLIDAYQKIVEDIRGGWCFEMNGLFAWALSQIGFDVEALAGFVGDDGSGRSQPATHMLLAVNSDEPLLVDVGFGGGLYQAIPLKNSRIQQPPYTIELTEVDDGFWRYSERTGETSSTFDFKPDPVGEHYFDEVSNFLQTSDQSPFVRTLTAQRRYDDRHVVLRGRLLRVFAKNGVHETRLDSANALVARLRHDFDLDVPEVDSLWPKIVQRHEELFGSAE